MAHLVCTDLHGNYSLWEQIHNDLHPEDTLYFLGDAIDRGQDGWAILKEMINDPRVIYILGNHEDMMLHYYGRGSRMDALRLWAWNGGEVTRLAMQGDNQEEVQRILEILRSKYDSLIHEIDINGNHFILTHAGYTPPVRPWEIQDILWNRNHFAQQWPEDKEYKNWYVLHGHTPIPYILEQIEFFDMPYERESDSSPLVYSDGHKICLDLMSIASGVAVVYELETMTYKIYEEK